MKKVIPVTMALLIALSLVACTDNPPGSEYVGRWELPPEQEYYAGILEVAHTNDKVYRVSVSKRVPGKEATGKPDDIKKSTDTVYAVYEDGILKFRTGVVNFPTGRFIIGGGAIFDKSTGKLSLPGAKGIFHGEYTKTK